MPAKRNRFQQLYYRFSVAMLVLVGGMLIWFVVQQIRAGRAQFGWNDDAENTFSSYPGFGIWIPNNFDIHGIDVSKYQQRINWKLVSQMKDKGLQLRFAFIKATEGTTIVDPHFKRNWRKSREANMARGAYHFFRQSSGGHEQALFFIRQVEMQKGDLPPVLDVETYNGQDLTTFLDEIEVWLKIIEDHYKVKPIIYTNAAFYNKYLSGRFDEYPLWVAHYQNQKSPSVDRNWHFWQHNEAGRVNGIKGLVDFNVFKGDTTDFGALLKP